MTSGTSHCTGPRTPEGKATSSMNAVKHGLTARTALLPGEDAGAFREFVWAVVEDLAPVGSVQRDLAVRAAVLMWKRRRVADAEEGAIRELMAKYEQGEPGEPGDGAGAGSGESGEAGREAPDRATCRMLADELAGEPGEGSPCSGRLARLARHEHRINQQIDSALRLLLRLQYRDEWDQQRQARWQRDGLGASFGQAQRPSEGAAWNPASLTIPAADGRGGRRAAPAGGPSTPPLPPAQNELPLSPAPTCENPAPEHAHAPPGA